MSQRLDFVCSKRIWCLSAAGESMNTALLHCCLSVSPLPQIGACVLLFVRAKQQNEEGPMNEESDRGVCRLSLHVTGSAPLVPVSEVTGRPDIKVISRFTDVQGMWLEACAIWWCGKERLDQGLEW